MSLKEEFESHPVIWGLSLLLAGSTAGFAVRNYLPWEQEQRPLTASTTCRIEGLIGLEEAHAARMGTLQSELVKLESSASDHSLIPSYQDRYKESADRIRQDISIENANYQTAIQTLKKTCE
jgi:hypothetical protein